jgi:signal transduction histidine kinase
MLDDLGLLATLLWHFERYTAQTKIQVKFKHTGVEQRFAAATETAAYRIIQEALTNVARYAGTNEVKVQLRIDEDMLNVQIEDQGTGFDPETTQDNGDSSGLSSMSERAALLNGQLILESTPGVGTRVTAKLPLNIPDQENLEDSYLFKTLDD